MTGTLVLIILGVELKLYISDKGEEKSEEVSQDNLVDQT